MLHFGRGMRQGIMRDEGGWMFLSSQAGPAFAMVWRSRELNDSLRNVLKGDF